MSSKKSHKCLLPKTSSRLNEKIYDYYMKFGRERDLEKFMRFSPAESQRSSNTGTTTTTATSSCTSDESGEVLRRLFHIQEAKMQREFQLCSSKSLPNIETEASAAAPKEHIIPITLHETTTTTAGLIASASHEDLTPRKKQLIEETQQVKTPDSIAKTHKRLEWDSLGDVGYKKSMSTSNISIFERSLLREFFQEHSTSTTTAVSEGDVQQRSMERKSMQESEKEKKVESKYNTPPLASSTLVEAKLRKSDTGTRPKMTNQGTSMSASIRLQNRFEQYAQTTLRRPSLHSQEVQVNMSSSATASLLGSCTTPSSFDYYSSRSSRTTSTDGAVSDTQKNIRGRRKDSKEFAAGISDLLARRKVLSTKNSQSQDSENVVKLQQLRNTLQHAAQMLDENKENNSSRATATTLLHSPQLEMGIKLLCSLIDARSLSQKEKKKLVREIVKRISHMSNLEDTLISTAAASEMPPTPENSRKTSVDLKQQSSSEARASLTKPQTNLYKIPKEMEGLKNLTTYVGNLSNSADSEELLRVHVYRKASPPTTSAKAAAAAAAATKLAAESAQRIKQTSDGNNNNNNNNNTKKSRKKTAASKVQKITSHKNQTERVEIDKPLQIDEQQQTLEAEKLALPTTTTITARSTNTDKSNSTPSMATSPLSTVSTSSSKELITQKETKNNLNKSNTDVEQETMREWLNPMTQSEVEYEEKKRESLKRETELKRAKLNRKTKSKNDTQRSEQLNWIETEIERLESLKYLLLKDVVTIVDAETTNESSATASEKQQKPQENQTNATTSTLTTTTEAETTQQRTNNSTLDKLYDTVNTEESSTECEQDETRAEPENVQEIKVIIEESNEDIINFNDKSKRSKERKRETQIIYDIPAADNNLGRAEVKQQIKERFRSIKETITTKEEKGLPHTAKESAAASKDKHSTQHKETNTNPIRSKIDTPHSSNESESVCSFVQQRKREFMQHYKNLKKNHYAALQQHQQHGQKLLQQQQEELQQKRFSASHHYSMPRAYMPHYHQQQQHPSMHYHYPQYHQVPIIPTAAPTAPPPPPVHRPTYSSLDNNGRQPNREQQQQVNSSSSGLCVSSEVSVPMGSHTNSSTSTTTHQYDDVAGHHHPKHGMGVGVQTGDSLLRSRPIYGPQKQRDEHCNCHVALQAVSSSQSAVCIQVKPKPIAYVIHFDKKSSSEERQRLSGSSGGSSDLIKVATTKTTTTTALTEDASTEAVPQLTLQDHLERANPRILGRIKKRKAILKRIQALRQERVREIREIVDTASVSSLDKQLKQLPPPAIKQLRVFPTKEMKAMTNKHCATLPEVLERQRLDHEERQRQGNRLLRDVFNRRLQKRVRSGKLSLNHSKTVI